MAQIDERALLPSERPSTSPPDPALHLNVRPAAFGGAVSEATQRFGSEALTAGQHWGQIAADDVATQWETATRKLLYGDPTKTITKADGTTGQDTGYFGLQGRLALEARPGIEKQMDQLTKDARGKLTSFDQQKNFDGVTRRYRNIQSTKIGEYADHQEKTYATNVNTATIKEQVEAIATNPNDDDMFLHHTANMVDAATKTAQLKGAQPGDAMWNSAQSAAKAAAAETRIRAIGANDPLRGIKMAEQYKGVLGSHYDNVVDHLRARADQQEGRQVADGVLSGAAPPAGDDTKAVLRHFEEFRSQAYQDNGGAFRAGYGSDTVTKADGTVVPVTPQTVVTQEDAERDLERRAAISQRDVRAKVGGEAFDALSPQAKASLTSIAYNYGSGNIPQTVVDAAKTGDPSKIAQAIRGLAGHNGGINRGRRASEANNIIAGGAPEASSLEDQIAEVRAKNLPADVENAAVARITKSHAIQNAAEVKREAEFKQKIDDTLASAYATGEPPTAPLTQSDFVRHYGPSKGGALYTEYTDNIGFSIDRKAMQGMSEVQQQKFLGDRMANTQPNSPGYSNFLKKQEKLEKEFQDIQKHRREDPAGAVSQNEAVRGAWAQYDEKNPATFKAVADARLIAQEKLGIEPEYRSPISKAEALKLTTSLDKPIPGTEAQVVAQVASKFRDMFGDNAQQAFAYALRARHVSAEIASQTASVYGKLASGVPLTAEDARRFDEARQDAAERAAVQSRGAPGASVPAEGLQPLPATGSPDRRTAPTGEFRPHRPGSAQDVLRKVGVDNPDESQVEGSPNIPKLTPTSKAIGDLQRGILTPEKFDMLFGAGTAKEILANFAKAGVK